MYHTLLEPLFREHEPQIDSFLANLKARAGEGAKGSIGWVWDTGRKAMGVSRSSAPSGAMRYELSRGLVSGCLWVS